LEKEIKFCRTEYELDLNPPDCDERYMIISHPINVVFQPGDMSHMPAEVKKYNY